MHNTPLDESAVESFSLCELYDIANEVEVAMEHLWHKRIELAYYLRKVNDTITKKERE